MALTLTPSAQHHIQPWVWNTCPLHHSRLLSNSYHLSPRWVDLHFLEAIDHPTNFVQILQSQDMGPHDHYSQNLHHGQQDDSRAYHSPSGLRRSGQSSPGSQPGTTAEGFDNMSSRTVEASYSDPRHHRQSPSWTSHAQFSDVLSPPYSQRLQYPRTNLPPIRDVAHGCDHSYQSDVGAYSQPYAPSVVSPNGLETSPYATERPSLYDTTQRYGQHCFQVNRPHPPSQMDYYRFPPPGTPYQTPPYTGLEYSSPSVGVHHPSSPTVCGDTDSRNRRRRGNLPKPVTDILRGWFHDHLDHPYPTEDDKQAFAARTGLTINQVSASGKVSSPCLILMIF